VLRLWWISSVAWRSSKGAWEKFLDLIGNKECPYMAIHLVHKTYSSVPQYNCYRFSCETTKLLKDDLAVHLRTFEQNSPAF
jgi:hypothetical protein